MSTSSSLSQGRFTTGVQDAWMAPRIRTGRKPLVVACHGAGAAVTAAGWLEISEHYVVQEIAAAGFPIVIPTLTDLWGNDVAVQRFQDAVAWGRANLGATDAPVVGLGGSAGFITVLHAHQVTPLACAVGVIPAVDLQNLRETDAFGVSSEIDTAYNVTFPAPLPSGVNPAEIPAAFASLPMQLHYSTTDAVTLPVSTEAFGAATGAELVDLGTGGHSDASVAAVDPDQVAAFIDAHA